MQNADAPTPFHPQVNGRTCGIAALASCAARSGRLPSYAECNADTAGKLQLDLHLRASRTGVWWPRFWGTSPWALSRLASEVTGIPYRIRRWVSSTFSPSYSIKAIERAISTDQDCFLFVGGTPDSRLAIPRHVVLILGVESTEGQWQIFEPSSGNVYIVAPETLAGDGRTRQRHFGNWVKPLLLVSPALGPATDLPAQTSSRKRTD